MSTITIKADTSEAEAAIERVAQKVTELRVALEGLMALGIGLKLAVNWDGQDATELPDQG